MGLRVGIAVGGDSVSGVVAGGDTLVSTSDRMTVAPVLVIAPGVGALVGAQAEQLAATGVGAVFRDFTGRVGDPVPVVGSDGSARLGADLVAMAVGGVLRRCAAGSEVAQLSIAHPTGWGPYEESVLRSALTCTGAGSVPTSLVSSPIAAVTAAVAAGVMSFSETAIVADIWGHGTEVALVTGGHNHVGRLVATSRTDDLCSTGLDRALARHVLDQVRQHLPSSDLHDPANRAIAQGVVAACRPAREALVRHTSAVVDVRLPARSVRVQVVRAEFESLAREPIHAGLAAISHLMDQARENGIRVDAIVLTGEVARTPLLTELISTKWPTRVVIPPCPEWAIASGTAHIAAHRSQPRPITQQSPAYPQVSNPHRPQPVHKIADGPPRRIPKAPDNREAPATRSPATASVPHDQSTGSERKWTLRWGAIQLTAAFVPNSHPQASDHRPAHHPHPVPRHC